MCSSYFSFFLFVHFNFWLTFSSSNRENNAERALVFFFNRIVQVLVIAGNLNDFGLKIILVHQPLPCQTQLSDPTAPTLFAGGTLRPLGAPSPPSPWPQPPPSQLKSSSASAAGQCPWWPSRRKIQLTKNSVIPLVTSSQCRSPLVTKVSNYWSIRSDSSKWSPCIRNTWFDRKMWFQHRDPSLVFSVIWQCYMMVSIVSEPFLLGKLFKVFSVKTTLAKCSFSFPILPPWIKTTARRIWSPNLYYQEEDNLKVIKLSWIKILNR